ncbi:MAG: esterase, partial [Candidatus Pelagibacter sp.]|nr:esterase [Candidatus Pelagibacter sp.]
DSALALYHWSPIADELKTLDRNIVLNSMILKWDNIEKEFKELINF